MKEHEYELTIEMESPITILPKTSTKALNFRALRKIAIRRHNVNTYEVKLVRKRWVIARNGKNRKQLLVLISSHEYFTPLIGLFWFDALSFELRTNKVAAVTTNNKSTKELMRQLHSKYRGVLQYYQTINGVKIKM